MARLTGFGQSFQSDTSATASSQEFTLGARAFDVSGNEYVYAKGTASVLVNTWVTFDEGLNVTRTLADAQGRVGIAMAAIPLNAFGWYQVYGKAIGNVSAAFADNGKVYLTATAGEVDDADVGQDFVVGAIGRSGIAGGSATMELNYPVVQDTALD